MKLIDKDALVAEIARQKAQWRICKSSEAKYRREMLDDISSFIDTLEVKEVDLDFQRFAKEMDEVFDLPSEVTTNTEEEPLNWEYAIAKHFFELGLNASNLLETDLETEQRIKKCPFREVICNRYEDNPIECDGRCSWAVDYLKLKRFKAQKGEEV